ncbi:MAG: PepSY domain-containing protein [Burkholderiales bacterium]|nr:PepSY domain-containing protein [Burkholderiales bacterium]
MKSTIRYAHFAAILCLGAAAPVYATSEVDARAALARHGYVAVDDLEFEDGLWEADVRRADGSRGEVAVDAGGRVHDARDGRPLLDAAAISAILAGAGYRDIRELERDGALWNVDAVAADGRRVELRLGGHDGSVLSEQQDD